MRIHDLSIKVMCILLYTGLFLLTGCGEIESSGTGKDNTAGEVLSDSSVQRETGAVTEGKVNEPLHTAFFDFQISDYSVQEYFTLGDDIYRLEEGYQFLICDVELSNPRKEAMDIYLTDFLVSWGDLEEEQDYGYGSQSLLSMESNSLDNVPSPDELEDYMPDTLSLGAGEHTAKKILFKVPVKKQYAFVYDEYYADGFLGNQFRIALKQE